jgi:hypothetical protein
MSNQEKISKQGKERRRKNPEKNAEKCKEWRTKNPDYAKAYMKEWLKENKEYKAKMDREYQLAHPEEKKARQRRYSQKHAQRLVDKNRNYRRTPKGKAVSSTSAHRRRVNGKNTPEEQSKISKWMMRILAKPTFKCYYCEGTFSTRTKFILHFDHIVALNKEGRNVIENYCVACRSCNSRKHTESATNFRNSQSGQMILGVI